MVHAKATMQGEIRKGPWTEEEDMQLSSFVTLFGDRRWDSIARVSGLKRTGKSCRLRWMNYLRPDLKHGRMSHQEEEIILQLHARWGNKWSRIALRLPGRTDNEIKNYWRTHLRKKAQDQEKEKNMQGELPASRALPSFLLKDECGSASQTSSSMDPIDVFFPPMLQMDDELISAVYPYESHVSNWASELLQNHEQNSEVSESGTSGFPTPDWSYVWDFCAGSLWDL